MIGLSMVLEIILYVLDFGLIEDDIFWVKIVLLL